MVSPLSDKIDQLRALCRKHHVKALWLFGSAAGEGFDDEQSDIDVIVQFEDMDYRERANHYYDLRDAMTQLLGRQVDLIEDEAISNPYFRAEVDRSRVLVHAA